MENFELNHNGIWHLNCHAQFKAFMGSANRVLSFCSAVRIFTVRHLKEKCDFVILLWSALWVRIQLETFFLASVSYSVVLSPYLTSFFLKSYFSGNPSCLHCAERLKWCIVYASARPKSMILPYLLCKWWNMAFTVTLIADLYLLLTMSGLLSVCAINRICSVPFWIIWKVHIRPHQKVHVGIDLTHPFLRAIDFFHLHDWPDNTCIMNGSL